MIELKGKEVANTILEELKPRIENLINKKITPTLAIIKVGNNYSDDSYQKEIIKTFNNLNTEVKIYELDKDNIEDTINKLNNDNNIHGIIIFRPLPKNINEAKIRNLVCKEKDVDAISDFNIVKLMNNNYEGHLPCTPLAIISLFNYHKIDLKGKKVTIIGRSNVVGKPLSLLLLNEDATVTICHSKTKDLENESQSADILISAAGVPNLINEKHTNKNQIIIDIGMSVVNSKIVGDVQYDKVNVKMLMKSLGGIGPITTAILLKQTINAAEKLNRQIN